MQEPLFVKKEFFERIVKSFLNQPQTTRARALAPHGQRASTLLLQSVTVYETLELASMPVHGEDK